MSDALRLILYDATQRSRPPRALGASWHYGSMLYRGLRRVDLVHGATSFAEAFDWLGKVAPERQISELQFWGHGKWGQLFIDREPLDRGVLDRGHEHHAGFERLRARLTPNALFWFRTCETLGAHAGQDFAKALGDATGARVAGHTFVIGFFQSGLHCLRPGAQPHWSPSEGLERGSAAAPETALDSGPNQPNTITCLQGQVPDEF
jgi:hypothetical protein